MLNGDTGAIACDHRHRYGDDIALMADLGVRHLSDTLHRPKLRVLISENGCAAQDELTPAGEVLDLDRIQYLQQYLHPRSHLLY